MKWRFGYRVSALDTPTQPILHYNLYSRLSLSGRLRKRTQVGPCLSSPSLFDSLWDTLGLTRSVPKVSVSKRVDVVLLTSITLTSLDPDSLRGESKSPFRKVHQMLLSTVPIKSLSPLPKARQRIPLTSLGIYNTNRRKERKGTVFIIN